MVFVTVSKGITSKLDNPELGFLHSECRLMIVNTGMKFHKDTLNILKVTEWTPSRIMKIMNMKIFE